MKKTFLVEIEIAEPWIQDGFEFSESRIEEAFQRGIGELLPYAYESETKIKVEEQNHGTPENTSENSKKPLRLLGNIAWENRIEDGDDYLDDRMNSLIDR